MGEEFGKEIEEESRKARTCSDDDDDENILGGSDTKKIDEFRENRLFFKAVMSGDLNKLNKFIEQNEGLLSARIPSSGKNALHVAINAGHVHIARRLISLMSKDELEVKRNDGLTVLHAAVETGNIEIAKCLVKKNSQLTVSCAEIEDIERHSHISSMATTHNVYSEFTYTPLLQAVIYGQAEMAHYLYSITSKEFLEEELDGTQGSALITQCIFRKYRFGFASELPPPSLY
ncbi:Transmembrane protein [Parasponia andersonii]|uniref:Transmembrane protein n=1 Tax=Parasponia andersonii TaxID=3476 RepID=A0A2P5DHB5_PARAD|nr:Transmembrane protein [Parasponia andersonii]